jgi:uncharacterized protein (TIRG00374 family)
VREPNSPRWWQVAASVTLAVALFAYFLSRVPLSEVAGTLSRVKLGWLLASAAASLASYAVRGLRWGVILEPLGTAGTGDLLGCTAAGFATSSVLPARAGEVIRPLLLSVRTGLPAAGTVASILTERLADLATVLVFFGVGVPLARSELVPAAIAPMRDAAVLAGAGFVAFALVVVALLRRRNAAVRWSVRLVPQRFKSKAESFLHHVLDGLEAVRSPRRLVRLALWSTAVWGLAVLQILFLARAFSHALSLPASAVFMVVSGLGLAVPTPAGVGGFHAAIQLALTRLFGVDLATATSFALLHHAVCFVPITVIGLTFVASVGFSVRRLRALHAPVEGEVEGP